jgi:hypothetical protein
MPKQDSVTYSCDVCGYANSWTRDEVLQRGEKIVWRDGKPEEDHYSLQCKNPIRPRCSGRYVVAVERKER